MSPAPCPSCGYDLSGIVASWSERCPLEGTCSECGGLVRWQEVLAPAPARLPWFVEHRWWNVLGMWGRMLVPAWFWKRIGAKTEGSAWRLMLWLPLLMVGLHLAKGVLGNLARLVVHTEEGFNQNLWLVWASDDWTQPFILIYYSYTPRISVLNSVWQWDTWPVVVWGLAAASVVAPVSLALIMLFTGRVHLRAREFWRATVYGLAWVPVFWLLGVIDSGGRLVRSIFVAAMGSGINGMDSEWLYRYLWAVWPWWFWVAAVWWGAWWWYAIVRGSRRAEGAEPDRDVAAFVVVLGLGAGVMAAGVAEVFR